MSTILIKNAAIIATFDSEDRIYKNKSVLIKDNKIAEIGDIKKDADQIIDGKGKVVIPGMINTHHHLYQTLTRNLKEVQDAKLFDWLKYLYNVWKYIDYEAVNVSAKVGMGELLLTGCTTTSDHLYLYPQHQENNLIDSEIEAARQMGIRFHPTRGSMSLGESEGGLPPDSVVQSDKVIMKESERVIDKYHDSSEFSMCRIVLAPCSPFSVTEGLMVETAGLAREKNVYMHTHLAETKDEEEFCLQETGLRPLAYMEKVGWVGKDVWFAHCVHLDDDEISKLADTQSGVAHCPSSNARLGSGIAPIRKMLDKGVNVSLGVDGSASNDSSDMLGEARLAMLVARIKSGVDSMSAYDVLKMATVGGAKVLGRNEIGVLNEGNAADIAVFNIDRIDFAGSGSDYLGALVFAGASHIADTVIVNGNIRVKDSALVGVNEREIVDSANRISEELRNKAGIE
ncbi:MAG: 8-oxoguanine deaminase [Elusimicrobia bacterium]|jgi:8-oxoguanine deaminase|nr:8-oxoguanine deaminase [Elusimicrobiota bacterium]